MILLRNEGAESGDRRVQPRIKPVRFVRRFPPSRPRSESAGAKSESVTARQLRSSRRYGLRAANLLGLSLLFVSSSVCESPADVRCYAWIYLCEQRQRAHLKRKKDWPQRNKEGFSAAVYEPEDQLPQVAVHNRGFMKAQRKLHGPVEQVGKSSLLSRNSEQNDLACPLFNAKPL